MSEAEADHADYEGWQVGVSAAAAVVVTAIVVWWSSGFGAFYETLFRVGPTAEGGGVGTDWVVGNTIPALDFLIALIHAMDVIMGVFILFMVVIHWAAFRRLADRMQRPGEADGRTTVADGGEAPPGGRPR